jgi:hypothetical protein
MKMVKKIVILLIMFNLVRSSGSKTAKYEMNLPKGFYGDKPTDDAIKNKKDTLKADIGVAYRHAIEELFKQEVLDEKKEAILNKFENGVIINNMTLTLKLDISEIKHKPEIDLDEWFMKHVTKPLRLVLHEFKTTLKVSFPKEICTDSVGKQDWKLYGKIGNSKWHEITDTAQHCKDGEVEIDFFNIRRMEYSISPIEDGEKQIQFLFGNNSFSTPVTTDKKHGLVIKVTSVNMVHSICGIPDGWKNIEVKHQEIKFNSKYVEFWKFSKDNSTGVNFNMTLKKEYECFNIYNGKDKLPPLVPVLSKILTNDYTKIEIKYAKKNDDVLLDAVAYPVPLYRDPKELSVFIWNKDYYQKGLKLLTKQGWTIVRCDNSSGRDFRLLVEIRADTAKEDTYYPTTGINFFLTKSLLVENGSFKIKSLEGDKTPTDGYECKEKVKSSDGSNVYVIRKNDNFDAMVK